MFGVEDTRTDKTMVIWFCFCALFGNSVRMKHWILPAANQYFSELPWIWKKTPSEFIWWLFDTEMSAAFFVTILKHY